MTDLNDYEPLKDAAAREGITESRARQFCREGRWDAVQVMGYLWFVRRGSVPQRGKPGRPRKNGDER
jgi:hypothetical protein